MIGILLVSAFAGTFALLYADGKVQYGVNYDNKSMETFNKLDDIKEISQEIEERHDKDTSNKNLIDVLGNLIADGIDITRLGATSYDALLIIKDKAAEKLEIPNIWSITAYIIIIILVFVGIILRIKLGAEI
jgi:hypothetical protein